MKTEALKQRIEKTDKKIADYTSKLSAAKKEKVKLSRELEEIELKELSVYMKEYHMTAERAISILSQVREGDGKNEENS